MVAMRPPAFLPTGDDSALGTALLAYAPDLYRERSTRTVNVHVGPAELDRSTMTIVYRIAQEALLNAARHSMAETVAVSVTEHEGNVKVEVHDDGVGFDLEAVICGSGLASMQLFTNLGWGSCWSGPAPVSTLVRASWAFAPRRSAGARRRRAGLAGCGRAHLRLIGPGSDEPGGRPREERSDQVEGVEPARTNRNAVSLASSAELAGHPQLAHVQHGAQAGAPPAMVTGSGWPAEASRLPSSPARRARTAMACDTTPGSPEPHGSRMSRR